MVPLDKDAYHARGISRGINVVFYMVQESSKEKNINSFNKSKRKLLEGIESLRQRDQGMTSLNSYTQLEQQQSTLSRCFGDLDSCTCHRHRSMVVGTSNIPFPPQAQIKNFFLDNFCVIQYLMYFRCYDRVQNLGYTFVPSCCKNYTSQNFMFEYVFMLFF